MPPAPPDAVGAPPPPEPAPPAPLPPPAEDDEEEDEEEEDEEEEDDEPEDDALDAPGAGGSSEQPGEAHAIAASHRAPERRRFIVSPVLVFAASAATILAALPGSGRKTSRSRSKPT
jgi:hypothetical protein